MPAPSLSDRLSVIKPSATVAISTRAKELKAQGIDVLSFSVGEPDFETPAHVQDAARAADPARFPSHAAFVGMQRNGDLAAPADVVAPMVAYIAGAPRALFTEARYGAAEA